MFQLLTRVGFAARGILYIVIGLLILRTGRTEDLNGALEYLGKGSGSMLLAVMAAGMATYGLWRLADAALGIENPGHDGKTYRKRAVVGVIGFIYLYLAYKAVRLLTGDESGGGQGSSALDLPGGALVLFIAAAIMLAAAAAQFKTAMECKFMARLDARAHRPFVKWFGRLGYSARGVTFLAVAYLIARAAMQHGSSKAAGMEQALDFLNGQVQVAVAAGLMLFGAFSLIEARFRRIHEPDVDQMKRDLGDKLPRQS